MYIYIYSATTGRGQYGQIFSSVGSSGTPVVVFNTVLGTSLTGTISYRIVMFPNDILADAYINCWCAAYLKGLYTYSSPTPPITNPVLQQLFTRLTNNNGTLGTTINGSAGEDFHKLSNILAIGKGIYDSTATGGLV
jgi:hypothetical protein